jgi:hypothetical protein
VRQILGKIKVPERRLRMPAARRNRRKTVPGAAGSGELLRRPGGVSGTGGKGEKERRLRPSYRRGSGKKRQVLNQELKGRNYRGETVAGVKFGPGEEEG